MQGLVSVSGIGIGYRVSQAFLGIGDRYRVSDTLSLRYRVSVSVSRLKSVPRYRVSDTTKTTRYLTPGFMSSEKDI